MKPALSQVCTLDAPLEKDIEDYAAGACQAIELWVGKLDAYLERHSDADLRGLLEQHGVTAPVASFQGGLLASQGEFRKQHWDGFSHRLDRCRSLGIGTLVLAADIQGPLAQHDLERVQLSLEQAAALAGQHGVRLALEFHARSAFVNNLQTAAALVAEVSSPHLGICLDVFHYYVGPSKPEDLGYLSDANLFHVQLCDVSGVPREIATDADRILPGDGDFQLEPLIARLREIDYGGYVSVELMNPQIWRIAPRQFGEIGMTALRKILGQASMG
ncbi:MAG: sugar phosphate isomerase/epimerase [Planctomycetia bacterium]|nr:sugar phosphate isomerase/epimerase [Planctomycetia bacterium]